MIITFIELLFFIAHSNASLESFIENLWLYWTAPFVGTIIAAFAFRGKFKAQREREAKS